MKQKGFTLVELLAVITIMSLVVLLITPNIIKSAKKSKSNINNFTNELIINASELYVKEHLNDFANTNNYCIKLSTLVTEDYIDAPIYDSNKEDITNTKSIKKLNGNYEIINNISTCK